VRTRFEICEYRCISGERYAYETIVARFAC